MKADALRMQDRRMRTKVAQSICWALLAGILGYIDWSRIRLLPGQWREHNWAYVAFDVISIAILTALVILIAAIISAFFWTLIQTPDSADVRNRSNQLPDPTSPSVTPPAGAGGPPSVAADH